MKQTLPHGWRMVQLSMLCVQDKRIISPDSEDAIRLPYIGLKDIESNTGKIISINNNADTKSSTYFFDDRHILYGKLRPYLNKIAVPDFKGRCTTELIPLLPNYTVSRDFLAWLLRRPAIVSIAMKEKTGSRMPRAKIEHILSLYVPIHENFETQKRIAHAFGFRMEAVNRAREALQEQLKLIDLLFNRMLEEFPKSGM